MIPLAKEMLLWHTVAKETDGTKLDSPNRPWSFSQRGAECPHKAKADRGQVQKRVCPLRRRLRRQPRVPAGVHHAPASPARAL